MALKYNINAGAPRVRALIEKAEAMDRDIAHSNAEVQDTILGGLITIVSDLEAAVLTGRPTPTINAAQSARLQSTADDLAFRSAEAGG